MKSKNILNYLFICIIINIVPVFLLKEFEISKKLYTILVILVYIIQTALVLWCAKSKIKQTSKKEYIALIIFFGLQVITQIINIIHWETIAIKDIAGVISVGLNIYIFICLCSKFKVTREEFIEFMQKMILLGLFACVYNVIYNIEDILHIFKVDVSYSLSISSFFANRNQFGFFLLIMILSNLYVMANDKKKGYKILQVFFIINLILTMSRNAILGLIVIYSLYLFLNYKQIIKNLTRKQLIVICIVISIIILTIIAILISVPKITDTINNLFIRSYTINSDSGRIRVWRNALEISLNNIFTGVGRFKAIELNNLVYQSNLEQFHNIYIEVLVSYGIIGITVLIYGIIKLFKKIKHSSINDNEKKIMLLGMITFLIVSCFETLCRMSIGYVDTISTIFFVTVPIIYSNFIQEKERDNE